MDDDSFIETGDNLTEIFSILEANDEQLRCIWKRIEEQSTMVKTLQSHIVVGNNEQVKFTAELKSQSDMLTDMKRYNTEIQNKKIEAEFELVYERISGDEQVSSFMLIIISILLMSVMIQHYDMGNITTVPFYRNFYLNSTEL
jgi:hypothetical protein|tara:strand:+ start:637 stop:1065 length:429 start_codon:yes stop_codon:yes gene_type:complete